jgi:hypothetical protein
MSPAASSSSTLFRESSSPPPLTPAEIANHLREILKPVRRRAAATTTTTTQERHSADVASTSMTVDEQQPPQPEKPVFTLKQMTLICEKICKVIPSDATRVGRCYINASKITIWVPVPE